MSVLTFDAIIYFLQAEYAIKKYDIDMLLVIVIAVSGIVCYVFPNYLDVRATYTQTWKSQSQ